LSGAPSKGRWSGQGECSGTAMRIVWALHHALYRNRLKNRRAMWLNKGDKGDKGDVGETGPMGPLGPVGPVGATGERGLQGETGAVGATGADGRVGDQGVQGLVGPQGPQGVQGEAGARSTTYAYTRGDNPPGLLDLPAVGLVCSNYPNSVCVRV
jgi:hypothetical protein